MECPWVQPHGLGVSLNLVAKGKGQSCRAEGSQRTVHLSCCPLRPGLGSLICRCVWRKLQLELDLPGSVGMRLRTWSAGLSASHTWSD